MELKPIPTKYNGYAFRSRLEARWAVFFDKLGIKYEYEPEGFILHDGTYYLPDFYLPDFRCYFEVKPAHLKDTPEGKAAEKKILGNIENGIITFGDPVDNNCILGCITYSDSGCGSSDLPVKIGLDYRNNNPTLLMKEKLGYDYVSVIFYDYDEKEEKEFGIPIIEDNSFFNDFAVEKAALYARQKDFSGGTQWNY